MGNLKTLNWLYLHQAAFSKAVLKFWTMAVIQFIVWKVNKIQDVLKSVYYFYRILLCFNLLLGIWLELLQERHHNSILRL